MIKYIIGFLKYFFCKRVSFLALVCNKSIISKKATIGRFVQFYQSSIGNYSYVCSRSEVVCADIGKFCSIARGCSIGLANHSINNLSTSPIFTEKLNATGFTWTDSDCCQTFNHIKIGNDVWIGKNVIVVGNVTINDGAVIGAGSIVTKDVPPYAIVAGVPAKIIRYRFDNEVIESLLQLQWWNFPEEKLRKNISIFQKEDLTEEDLKLLV